MDPTAPKDNQQTGEGDQENQNSPIQTGQFVVSPDPGANPGNNPNPAPTQPQPENPLPTPPPTQPDNLQADVQESVAAATGPNLAGELPQTPPTQSTPPAPEAPPVQSPQVPPAGQPNPVPFTPPTQSPPTQQQGAQPPEVPTGEGSSKIGKFKIFVIIIGLLVLITIIAALVWFFVLNKSSQTVTTSENFIAIEEPVIPSPATNGGFSDIPEATQEATEEPEPESEENL